MRTCSWQKSVLVNVIILAGWCSPTGASWADSGTLPSTTPLDTLEAIAGPEYRTRDIIPSEESTSSSSLDRQALTRTPAALAEILAHETGVQQRQSGGFGSFASVTIRAASAAQTSVYLDGILLNSAGMPIVDLSTLEILNLGSVDIYRGSTPLQLGHGGIGGAINLNTLHSEDKPDTRIRLSAGSFAQSGWQLAHQASNGAWDWLASASHQRSDNDFPFTNTNGTPLNPADDAVQKRENSQAARTSLLLKSGYRHSVDARTDLTVQVAERLLGVPEWRNRPQNDASYDTVSTQVQLSQVLDGLAKWNSRHSVYWHDNNAEFTDESGQIGLGAQATRDNSTTLGINTYWEYLANSGTLGMSFDLRQELLDANDRLDPSGSIDAQRTGLLGTAHYNWYDSTEQWMFTPAVRWQSSESTANYTTTENQQAIDDSQSAHIGLQLGVTHRVNALLSLSANLGNFYREPSFGELYRSIGLINANPELKPEQGTNADIGARYQGRQLTLQGSLFVSERDELIVTSFDSRGVGRTINSGAAQVVGVELSTEWKPTESMALSSNLTWQSPRSTDRNSGFHNKFLPGEAQLAWFGKAQLTRSNWSYWYELNTQSKLFYDRANLLPAPDIFQQNAGLAWHNAHWQGSFGVNNLGDTNVQDFNGFPKPGRSWFITISRSL